MIVVSVWGGHWPHHLDFMVSLSFLTMWERLIFKSNRVLLIYCQCSDCNSKSQYWHCEQRSIPSDDHNNCNWKQNSFFPYEVPWIVWFLVYYNFSDNPLLYPADVDYLPIAEDVSKMTSWSKYWIAKQVTKYHSSFKSCDKFIRYLWKA